MSTDSKNSNISSKMRNIFGFTLICASVCSIIYYGYSKLYDSFVNDTVPKENTGEIETRINDSNAIFHVHSDGYLVDLEKN